MIFVQANRLRILSLRRNSHNRPLGRDGRAERTAFDLLLSAALPPSAVSRGR